MKPTMPPINSSDNLFHDGDLATQRDGTPVTAAHLNNVQASVIDLQDELKKVLTETGAQPDSTIGQVATAIVELVSLKLTKIAQAVAFAVSPTVPDAAQPYHPVNLRQLQSAGTGGGATMSGVMNNFIGAVEWFNGSRAKIPAGYIPADGQVVSRTAAETADLWAAVNNGFLTKVTDTDWLNGPGGGINAGQYRGKYSTGGTSNPPAGSGVTGAWFRVPDLNGATSSSIPAVFLRGDAGGRIGTEIGGVGEVLPAAAPDIQGSASFATNAGYAALAHQPTGAFTGAGNSDPTLPSSALTGGNMADRFRTLNFSAKNSNQVYGRVNANGLTPATEIRPNSVTGIWIIRASGSFAAAGTEFNAISADTAAPANGTTVHGGIVKSRYNAAGVTRLTASNYANQPWGSAAAMASHNLDVTVYDASGAVVLASTLQFFADGKLKVPGMFETGDAAAIQKLLTIQRTSVTGSAAMVRFLNGSGAAESQIYGERDGDITIATNVGGTPKYFGFDKNGNLSVPGTVQATNVPVTSDRDAKDNIQRIADPLEKLEKLTGNTYTMKENGQTSAGVIAQEVQEVLPEVVRKIGDHLTVEYSGVDALLVEAVKELHAQVKELKAEIAELKSK